jgi:hypothetical protein
VQGGARLSKESCLLWRMDMLPQPQPDAETPAELVALDMYNHTVGFQSGESTSLAFRMVSACIT